MASYDHSSIERIEEETRISVKYIQQLDDYSCGAASLIMVLNYWDVPLNQKQLLEKHPPLSIEKGYSIGELKMIAKEIGMQAFSLKGNIDFVKKQISIGRPVICVLEKSQDNSMIYFMRKIPIMGKFYLFIWKKLIPSDYHFIVVSGFSKKTILLIDPISGYLRMSINRFQTIWSESQYALLLVAR